MTEEKIVELSVEICELVAGGSDTGGPMGSGSERGGGLHTSGG